MRRRLWPGIGIVAILLWAAPVAARADPEIGLRTVGGETLTSLLVTNLLPGQEATTDAVVVNTGTSTGTLQITATGPLDHSHGPLADTVDISIDASGTRLWRGPANELVNTVVTVGDVPAGGALRILVGLGLDSTVRKPTLEGSSVTVLLTFTLTDTGAADSQATVPFGSPSETEVAGTVLTRGGDTLALTGTDVAAVAAVALLCIAAGILLTVWTRRRATA